MAEPMAGPQYVTVARLRPTLSLVLGLLAVVFFSDARAAADVTGIWFTEKRDNGAFISVRISPCLSDREKRCGTVAGAHGGARPDIVGEPIL
ncbi:MAG: hypothetical protein AAFU72_12805, partial [Pseudomonadota bacterium]